MIRSLTVCTVILSIHIPTTAQQPLRAEDIPISAEATAQAKEFQKLKVDRRLVNKRYRKLTKELTWHKKLDDALGAARQSGKPVVWIHALGKLTGYV